jgi:hypothetical protein
MIDELKQRENSSFLYEYSGISRIFADWFFSKGTLKVSRLAFQKPSKIANLKTSKNYAN